MISPVVILLLCQINMSAAEITKVGDARTELGSTRPVPQTQPLRGHGFLFFGGGKKDFHLLELEFLLENGIVSGVRTLKQLSYGRRPIRFFVSRKRIRGLLDPIPNLGSPVTSESWTRNRLQEAAFLELESPGQTPISGEAPKIMLVPYAKKDLARGYLQYFKIPETWSAIILESLDSP